MNFDEYQERTNDTAVFPEEIPDWLDPAIVYCAMALDGEAGEVAEKVKKAWREDDPTYLWDVKDELGDVIWYWAQLCQALDFSADDVAESNLAKLQDRAERDAITGEGDDR